MNADWSSDNKVNAKVSTCTQPHKRVGLQQGRDEGQGICRQGIITFWPNYII